MAGPGVPVVFIHGPWLHSTSWQPWADLFRQAGYDPVTPSGPACPTPSRRRGSARRPRPA